MLRVSGKNSLQKLKQEQKNKPDTGKSHYTYRIFFPCHLFFSVYTHNLVNQVFARCQNFGQKSFLAAHDVFYVCAQRNCQNNQNGKVYLEQIKYALQKIDNHKFEDIIGELFIKNGYTLTDNNWYDREGGDVDLVFECFNRNTLMYNIYEICDVKMPHIYVQAKKKTGQDTGDIVGVDQLVKMEARIPEKNAILMVINLTDEFSEEAKAKADEKGIILINGSTFASLLVRYGIEVDIR